MTPSATGTIRGLPLPSKRKANPTTQPTSTLMMRLRKSWRACLGSGSEAATKEAIAQIGVVS